jgi:FtsH-binding integral membrane protein
MISYFSWWFYDEPKYLWRSINIVIIKVFNTFSIPLLITTLFAPWKRDVLYVENPSLSDSFQIFIGNMVSRLIGCIVRILTIFAGLIVTIITAFFVYAVFLAWILLPVIIILLFINGMRTLNG